MKQKILTIIKDNSPVSFGFIRKKMNLFKTNDLRQINVFLNELIREEKIYYKSKEEKYYIKNEKSKIGIFSETRHSYSFIEEEVTNEQTKEIEKISYFTPEKFSSNALNGDTVKFILLESVNKNGEKSFVAKVIRILKRNGGDILGEILKNDKNKLEFVPIDRFQKHKYFLKNINDLKEGNFVSAKFIDYKEKIIYLNLNEVISENYNSSIDHIFVLRKNLKDVDFNQEIKNLNYQKLIQKQNQEDKDRIDLTNELIYTIDGETSKDLDDAISLSKKEDNFLLKVHIADVSYYVEEDSILDQEAKKRANSIYLIDFVRPMLPKILSDDLCSLNPNTIKKTLTAEMLIDSKGNVLNKKIYRSKIISKFRLTYSDVDKYLENKQENIFDSTELKQNLNLIKELSDILRKRKVENGMIDFILPEIKVKINEKKEPIDIYNKYQTLSEKIIEDLMVVANESVAEFLDSKDVKAIFRIHQKPSLEKLYNLKQFARTIFNPKMFENKNDYNVIEKFLQKNVNDITSKDLANYISKVNDLENSVFFKVNLIQTMEKARYEIMDYGHYALGLKHYLHFTSPIRRYADLVVHRILGKIFDKKLDQNNAEISNLTSIAEYVSQIEKESIQIERELNDIKKARYVKSNYSNQVLNGVIVNILAFGFFVDIDNKYQGLVRFSEKEKYLVSENKLSFDDKQSKKRYYLFNPVKVKINNIDTYQGTIDMELME